jgi:phosphatidylethanolamine-binding protein (PEBP) family uncharacterized protein
MGIRRGWLKTRKVQRGGRVGGLRFPSRLSVSFGDVQALGQLIVQSKTIKAPAVKWPTEVDRYYTLICIDPDAKASAWLHWLVINCDGGGPETGTELVKWAPPTPPSGTHTYYFCLFSHSYKVPPEVVPAQRGYFKIDEFAKQNGLHALRISNIKVSSN